MKSPKDKINDKLINKPHGRLPKDALSRLNLGQSFAEYDTVLRKPDVFVITPALIAATDASRGKTFYVGRRGTGKTAITIYLNFKYGENTIQILPAILRTKLVSNSTV